jgi:DNA-directed RNA polymerase specialized sigma24 family protein
MRRFNRERKPSTVRLSAEHTKGRKAGSHRLPPPAPNRTSSRKPGPGRSPEEIWLARWEPRIPALAAKVWHPERVGSDRHDVQQELRLAIMLACRHREASGEPVTDGYINRVLRNTLISIGRSTRTAKRSTINEDGFHQGAASLDAPLHDGAVLADILPSPLAPPDAAMEAMERDEGLSGLVYLLRTQLSPATFAMLHLRFAEEWSPEMMAQLLGYGTIEEWTCRNCAKHSTNPTARCCPKPNRELQPIGQAATGRISQSLSRAKADAITFLGTLGVLGMEDAEVLP